MAEVAMDVGDGEVSDGEVDFAVSGVGGPGGGLRQGQWSGERQNAGDKCQSLHSFEIPFVSGARSFGVHGPLS